MNIKLQHSLGLTRAAILLVAFGLYLGCSDPSSGSSTAAGGANGDAGGGAAPTSTATGSPTAGGTTTPTGNSLFAGTWNSSFTVTSTCVLFQGEDGQGSKSTTGTSTVTISEADGHLTLESDVNGECPATYAVKGTTATMTQNPLTCGAVTTTSATIASRPNGTLTLHVESTLVMPNTTTSCPLTTESTLTRQ